MQPLIPIERLNLGTQLPTNNFDCTESHPIRISFGDKLPILSLAIDCL